MAVQPLRRLDTAATASLYQRLSREVLSCTFTRAEVDRLQSSHANLIVEHKGNLLAALRHGNTATLVYAFQSRSDFADHFAPMFERLLPRVRKAYAPDTVRFRLTDGPSRPVVEPVLRRLSFEPRKTWFQFSLEKGAKSPRVAVPRGVKIREGGRDDLDDLVRLDREAFPEMPMPPALISGAISAGERVLLATEKGEATGFALFTVDGDESAYIHTLAVGSDHRGKGIGANLALRVAKLAFTMGADRVDLRTDDDNAAAIRLYRWLGFKHTGSGRDYERPADPSVIEAMRRQGEGTFIKFGGWR